MQKKTTINGKEYLYDYKIMWIRTDVHKKIKELASKRGKTMVQLIYDLIENEISK